MSGNLFHEKLEYLSEEQIIKMANNLVIRDHTLLKHYPLLISFSERNLANRDLTTIMGLAHMIYGWMPTMLNRGNVGQYSNNELVDKIWENISTGALDKNFIEHLIGFVNYSIIGASKLLHFCNPNSYAIYDSNAYATIKGRKAYNHSEIDDISKYIAYMEKLKALSKNAEFIQGLKNVLVTKKVDVNISDIRCIEMCLFYTNKEKKT